MAGGKTDLLAKAVAQVHSEMQNGFKQTTRKCSNCGKKISGTEFSSQDRMCYKCWRLRGGSL